MTKNKKTENKENLNNGCECGIKNVEPVFIESSVKKDIKKIDKYENNLTWHLSILISIFIMMGIVVLVQSGILELITLNMVLGALLFLLVLICLSLFVFIFLRSTGIVGKIRMRENG